MIPADLPTGLIRGESIDAYHDANALSKTKLDVFHAKPAGPLMFYKKFVERSLPREKLSDAFRIGLGAHALILEGEEAFAQRFAVVPSDAPDDLRRFRNAKKPSDETLKAIAWWDQFTADTKGKTLVTGKDVAIFARQREEIRKHPLASLLLSQGEAEVTFRVKAERYFLQCRPDWFGSASRELTELLWQSRVKMDVDEAFVVDLKTVSSLSELNHRTFAKSFVNYGYHRSGPFYTAVMRDVLGKHVERFFFVAVETQEPFSVGVFLADDEANRKGWEQVEDDLKALNRCLDTGEWPGVPTHVQAVKLPGWYTRGDEEAFA